MTLPLPIIAFVAILFGYPLIQIAAIRLRRPIRLTFNALLSDMLADPANQGEVEQRAVSALMGASRGAPSMILAPVMVPAVVIGAFLEARSGQRGVAEAERAFALTFEHFANLPVDSPLWADPRLDRAFDLSMMLSIAVWPISMFVGIVATIPAAALLLVVAFVQRWSPALLSPRDVAVRLTRVLQVLAHP